MDSGQGQMTTQALILGLYFICHISQHKGLIVLCKLQMIVVLTLGIIAGRFGAYNLQSMHSKRCDRPNVAVKSDLEVSQALRRL